MPTATPVAEPAFSPAPPYSPGATTGAKTPILSILSLVAGILALLGVGIVAIPFVGSVLGLFFPAAAIILGILGKKREPNASKGLWLTGIILGAIALAIAIIAAILWGLAVAASGSYSTY